MRVAVVAEQNFNLIDGSTIWLLNVCKLLAMQPDLQVDLILSHRLKNMVLAQDLPPQITCVDSMSLDPAADHICAAVFPDLFHKYETRAGAYDRIFVRGEGLLNALLCTTSTADRVVAYAPVVVPDLSRPDPDWIAAARRLRTPVVIQSEQGKAALESLYDYPASLIHAVPPVVFPVDFLARDPDGPVKLCYSGKIDVHYGLDWLVDCVDSIGDAPDLGAVLIGGKDTHRAKHPDFFRAMDDMRGRIQAGEVRDVTYADQLPHKKAQQTMAQADFAYCLRHDCYDDVIEISTKIVEFCALGVVPILNKTALNQSLFGTDYPYFIDIETDDVQSCILSILRDRGSRDYCAAQTRMTAVAARFAPAPLSDRLGRAIRRGPPPPLCWPAPSTSGCRRKIVIATHDPKFLHLFTDRLRGEAGVDLVWEHWRSTEPQVAVPALPDQVDTVFCEWCCGNAVWHSHNKRAGTRLIVRLHRFEAFRDFPDQVNWSNVDALIVVSDWFRDRMITRHGVDPNRIHVLPQFINFRDLRREKLPESRFTVGLVGINPFEHKRLDRALDFFAALRQIDARFLLAVRSVMPWEVPWVWNRKDNTRDLFHRQFSRIFDDPDLAHSVRFDPAGPDMEEWYRGVGTILSSSDSEGCHTSVIEAMASGCLPVVHNWPGAAGLFGPHVHENLKAAIPQVIGLADNPGADLVRQNLSAQVACHDVEHFTRAFLSI